MRVTESWRLKGQRYTLEGVQNEAGQVNFPPRPVAPRAVMPFNFEDEAIGIDKETLRQEILVKVER